MRSRRAAQPLTQGLAPHPGFHQAAFHRSIPSLTTEHQLEQSHRLYFPPGRVLLVQTSRHGNEAGRHPGKRHVRAQPRSAGVAFTVRSGFPPRGYTDRGIPRTKTAGDAPSRSGERARRQLENVQIISLRPAQDTGAIAKRTEGSQDGNTPAWRCFGGLQTPVLQHGGFRPSEPPSRASLRGASLPDDWSSSARADPLHDATAYRRGALHVPTRPDDSHELWPLRVPTR